MRQNYCFWSFIYLEKNDQIFYVSGKYVKLFGFKAMFSQQKWLSPCNPVMHNNNVQCSPNG